MNSHISARVHRVAHRLGLLIAAAIFLPGLALIGFLVINHADAFRSTEQELRTAVAEKRAKLADYETREYRAEMTAAQLQQEAENIEILRMFGMGPKAAQDELAAAEKSLADHLESNPFFPDDTPLMLGLAVGLAALGYGVVRAFGWVVAGAFLD